MHIAVDGWSLVLFSLLYVLLMIILLRWRYRQPSPHFLFSKTKQLTQHTSMIDLYPRIHLPTYCKWAALALLLIAFINPHLLIDRSSEQETKKKYVESLPVEGAAIYFVLDHSSSMKDTVFSTDGNGKEIALSKLDLLKEVTTKFIKGDAAYGLRGRDDDLIGLVSFARIAQVLSPLTLDHKALLQMLSKIHVVDKEDRDGTALGYALFKTVNLIAATKSFSESSAKGDPSSYAIKSAAIVLVTDGFPYPNPLDKGHRLRNMDIDEAAQYAKEQQVKLYIVNIDPKMGESRFSPIREQMKRSAESTGGRYYLLNDHSDLQQVYSDIDHLEKNIHMVKGEIETANQKHVETLSFYPYLIAIALVLFGFAVALESFVWRVVP